MQVASTILMIRPAAFGYNEQTAADNAFQELLPNISLAKVQERAQQEFDDFVDRLREKNIETIVVNDTHSPSKTDAVFLNNWISTLPNGIVSIFPLYAADRRLEKRDDVVQMLQNEFAVSHIMDWSELEADGFFLEGTGSMVIDHVSRLIYACHSQRTHPAALEKFAACHQYKAIMFEAVDETGKPIYHTNVMLCIGEDFAMACGECFMDELEWIAVSQLLRTTGHRIITISLSQMKAFAGNMLQVENKKGEKFLVMSQRAYDALTKDQIRMLESYTQLLPVNIPTIETLGGGSARCMMTEIFLERKIH